MMIFNDVLHWLISIPPVYWLSQQPVPFLMFEGGVIGLLIIAVRGMRGPEM